MTQQLFQRLARLEHLGGRIGRRLGSPQHARSIAFVVSTLDGATRTEAAHLLRSPYITTLPRRLVGLVVSANDTSAITLTLDDYELRVPRDVSETLLSRIGNTARVYVVVGHLQQDGSLVGWRGSVLSVDDSGGTIWSIVLRQASDGQTATLTTFESTLGEEA